MNAKDDRVILFRDEQVLTLRWNLHTARGVKRAAPLVLFPKVHATIRNDGHVCIRMAMLRQYCLGSRYPVPLHEQVGRDRKVGFDRLFWVSIKRLHRGLQASMYPYADAEPLRNVANVPRQTAVAVVSVTRLTPAGISVPSPK